MFCRRTSGGNRVRYDDELDDCRWDREVVHNSGRLHPEEQSIAAREQLHVQIRIEYKYD